MIRRSCSLAALLAIMLAAALASADTLKVDGTLYSTTVSGTDPAITDPYAYLDAFSLTLNYDPASFTQSGSTYTLTDASLDLTVSGLDEYNAAYSASYSYSTAAGNYLSVSSPGAYGSGTVSFLVCSAESDCFATDYLDLYFTGTMSSLAGMANDANSWTADTTNALMPFESLRNFADYSQTDLQGSMDSVSGTVSSTGPGPSPVPEPATLTLVASGLGMAWARRKKISR